MRGQRGVGKQEKQRAANGRSLLLRRCAPCVPHLSFVIIGARTGVMARRFQYMRKG